MSKAKLNKIVFSGSIAEVKALDSTVVKAIGSKAVAKMYFKRLAANN